MKVILLAGNSGVGKSTLAVFLGRFVVSTSALLASLHRGHTFDLFERSSLKPDEPVSMNDEELAKTGNNLDMIGSSWLVDKVPPTAVVDAVRSETQLLGLVAKFGSENLVLVNVVCDESDRMVRLKGRWNRGKDTASEKQYLFANPDFTWHSSKVALNHAAAVINGLAGSGFVDIVVGGQYGSEGKGKLCSLLASQYTDLVRSGGPNAGHWVREDRGRVPWEYCFHQIPSGAKNNPVAQLCIAAGATLNITKLVAEVQGSNCGPRLWVDRNAMLISGEDILEEAKLVDSIGSTAQGVGKSQMRRISREGQNLIGQSGEREIRNLRDFLGIQVTDVARHLGNSIVSGGRVMLEGTQGSGLSLLHGPYPYVTSRDTNSAGLLSEVGVAPGLVRDTWLVVRTYPIRVGGNSGPMVGEVEWSYIAGNTGVEEALLRGRERTSTTNRQRRVGLFDRAQFLQACRLNNPTKIFLTFADYVDPTVQSSKTWADVPVQVRRCVELIERTANCPVVGISTGRMNSETVWRPGFEVEPLIVPEVM